MQSGAWTSPTWSAIDKELSTRLTNYAAQKLNCTNESNFTDCIKEADRDTLLKLQNDEFFAPVTAVVDGELLTKNPYEFLAEEGVVNVKEIMTI